MISSRVSSSRLPVGSSASRTLGLLDQGAGDGDALLLAAGQLGGQVPGPVAQADLGQRPASALPPLARRHAERDQRGLDVLLGGQGRDEVEGLEDEADRGRAHAR